MGSVDAEVYHYWRLGVRFDYDGWRIAGRVEVASQLGGSFGRKGTGANVKAHGCETVALSWVPYSPPTDPVSAGGFEDWMEKLDRIPIEDVQ